MSLLSMMMESASAPQAPIPTIPESPEVIADPTIDFSEKQKELANKVRADYKDDQSRKRTRSSTILTSPLLDEELGNKSLLSE